MSIFMDGSVQENHMFEGKWKFAIPKDKKAEALKFHYTRKDDKIPNSLYEHVAFLTNEDNMLEKQKKLKHKHTNDIPSVIKSENPIIQVSHDRDIDGVGSNQGTETQLNCGAPSSGQLTSDTESAIPTTSDTPRIINRIHPLLGVWEGHFEFIPGQSDHVVQEAFFFHSLIGFDSSSDLSELPFEPSFSYSLLKVDENAIRRFIKSIDSNYVFYSDVQHSDLNATPDDLTRTTLNSSEEVAAVVPEVIDNPHAEDQQTAQAISTSASNSSDVVMLWGFGSNSIGRFSIVGAYRPASGQLTCEKKYILSKGWKRCRRYNTDSSFANTKKVGFNDEPEQRVSRLRGPSTAYISKFLEAPSSVSQSHNITPSKRKKPSSSSASSKSRYPVERPISDKHTYEYEDGKYFDEVDSNIVDGYRSAYMDDETGEIYEGGWYNGVRHGYGIALYCDGNMYEGNWNYGKESGKGKLMTGDRQIIYSGDWFDGLMHGQGVFNYANGDVYSGDWKEGHRHGKGDYVCKTGCRYTGDFKDGRRTGKGTFLWPDNSVYDGEWENDLKHGRGLLTLACGFRYDGVWANNFAEGRGTCMFSSGQEYQGSFKQGLREGRGSIKFAEGAEYEGRFRDDRIDGQGTIKIHSTTPGPNEGEVFVPIQIQADIKRIHMKAGFGNEVSH